MILNRLLTKENLVSCASAGFFILGSMAASGATFVVNSTSDSGGVCDATIPPSQQVCTLRGAVEAANSLAGSDTVELPSGIFSTGEIVINDDVLIVGVNGTVLDGSNDKRYAFDVAPGANNSSPTAYISTLTIQNYRNSAGTFNSDPYGAVNTQLGATTYLYKLVITNNYNNLNGGGVFNLGTTLIRRSEISHNEANKNNAGGVNGRGGGIYSSGTLSIENSLIHANESGKGGGIFVSGGEADIFNTTISENTSLAEGGGIGVSHGSVEIVHSTITKNQTALTNDAARRHGGGLYVGALSFGPSTTVNISNSIVADNIDSSYLQSDSVDCYKHFDASLTSYRNNIIGELSADCGITDYANSDLTGILYGVPSNPLDPKLSATLESLEGEPGSYPLLDGSPALDAVVSELPAQYSYYRCADRDQRGAQRLAESEYGGQAVCDIGAYEKRLQTTILEAEDSIIFGALVSGECAKGSGRQCVSAYGQNINEYDGAKFGHRMHFSVFIEESGYYSLDAWVQASSGADNSFYVGIDDQEPFIWDTAITGADIKRQRIVRRQGANPNPQEDYEYYFLERGHHTVEFFLREGGTVLDRIAVAEAASQFGILLDGFVSASSEHVVAYSNTSFEFYLAGYANDRQPHTEWRSNEQEGGSAWIQLSLSEPHVINTVVLDWSEGLYPAAYELQVSNDGSNWQTVYTSDPLNDGGRQEIALSGAGKYVRMQGIATGTWSNNYGLKEFRIYGTPLAAPAQFDRLFDEDDQNFFPYASGTVNDLVFKQGQGSFTIDLDSLFVDPDGESLNFNRDGSHSDSTNVVFTDNSRKTIRIQPNEVGTETFEIIANDASGEEAVLTFSMTVLPQNTAPTVLNPIEDRAMYLGQPCQMIDMDTVFRDYDNGGVTYINNTNSLNGNFLGGPSKFEICTNRVGQDTFNIIAIDADGAQAVDSFTVRVEDETSEVQPEQMMALNATIDANHSGYTGSGFLNTENSTGTWFDVPVVITSAGSRLVSVRYANGSTARPLNIYLNGEYKTTINLPNTGSWSNWSLAFASIEGLQPGFHTLRFEATTSGGAPNIDKIEMEAF